MDPVRLSKLLSQALRHKPEILKLNLDEEGWVPIDAVLGSIRQLGEYWSQIERGDLQRLIETSDKKRFEIDGVRIRARYGHSIPARLAKAVVQPPELLFHGTTPAAAEMIHREGLKPMARQYVHLSVDVQTALVVGRRKCRDPVVLRVHAGDAFRNSIGFYSIGDNLWLSDPIPSKFISREQS